MKKTFLSAYLLIALLLTTSCNNEEISVETVAPIHSLTLNISSQGIYDEFELTSDIKNSFLREGGYGIGIFSYVYDANGNIVDSIKSTLESFNTAVQSLPSLAEGDYTVITIETLVNKDHGNLPESWRVDDAESISTIKLRQSGNTYWPEIVGVATIQVKMDSNKEINIKPKAVGSIIHHYQYDFDQSNLINVGFATDGMTDYYSLNPQLAHDDRIKVDLTKKGYINVRLCDEVEAGSNYVGSIYIIESEITWMNIAQDQEDIDKKLYSTWKSDNATLEDGITYYAGFYYLYSDNEGTYAASYLGTIDGMKSFVNEWKKWKEQNIKNGLYAVPYINWNIGTVSAVKSFMSDFTLYQDIQYSETSNTYEMIYVDTQNSYTMYIYSFKSSTSGLTDAYVYLDGDVFTLEKVKEEVEKEGYTYDSSSNNNYYYTGSSTYVTVYKANSGDILVNYYNPKAYGLAPKHMTPINEISVIRNTTTHNRKSLKNKESKKNCPSIIPYKESSYIKLF